MFKKSLPIRIIISGLHQAFQIGNRLMDTLIFKPLILETTLSMELEW
jgi:hypothetical protein